MSDVASHESVHIVVAEDCNHGGCVTVAICAFESESEAKAFAANPPQEIRKAFRQEFEFVVWPVPFGAALKEDPKKWQSIRTQ